MQSVSELCPTHSHSKWLCLEHREMHMLLVSALRRGRPVFGNLALLKCLLKRL